MSTSSKNDLDIKLLSENISDAIINQDWRLARRLLGYAISKFNNNHWFYSRLSSVLLVEGKTKTALGVGRLGLLYANSCPLVYWSYANALRESGKYTEALKYFNKILDLSKTRNNGSCWESTDWKKGMMKEANIRIAQTYESQGNHLIAIEYRAPLKSHFLSTPDFYHKKSRFYFRLR